MSIWPKLPTKILTMLAATLSLALPVALADSESLSQAYAEYNAGNYSEAMGHLQGALSTDFNNAKLHYYLANTYVHLNRKDAGIREFRIAYALEPEKEVGKLSKQALGYLGADESKPKESGPKEGAKKAPSDPVLDRITAALKQQAEDAKSINRTAGDTMANEYSKRSSDQYDKAKQAMQNDMSYYRRGRLIQLPLPEDALKQLDSLKQQYDAQKSAAIGENARHSDEIQKSADNLTGLLNEKGKAGGPKLVPEGTNLYIRNYKNQPPSSISAPTTSTPGTSTPTAGTPPTSTTPTKTSR